MPQKFDAINKGDLTKFDGKKARILVNGWGQPTDGEFWVNGDGHVVFLTDADLSRTILEPADPRAPYAHAYVFYYSDDPDTFITNEYVASVEIL